MTRSLEIRKDLDGLQASLREARNNYDALGDKATTEDRQKLVRMTDQLNKLCDELTIAETDERVEQVANSSVEMMAEHRARQAKDQPAQFHRNDEYRSAFIDVAANGREALPESHALLQKRAFETGAGAGQVILPDGAQQAVEIATKKFGAFINYVTDIRTPTGNPLPFPLINDTAQEGIEVAQNTAPPAADMAANSVIIGAIQYCTREFIVSRQVLRDTPLGEGQIVAQLGKRLGRIYSKRALYGTGTGQISGLLTGSARLAPVALTAVANNLVTNREILKLIYSIDESYAQDSMLAFARSTLEILHGSTDSQNRPLYPVSLAAGMPSTVNGVPFFVWNEMPAIAATNKPFLCGDFKAYKFRRVGQTRIQMLQEFYARQNSVGFLGFEDADGSLVDAGGNPIKALQMAA